MWSYSSVGIIHILTDSLTIVERRAYNAEAVGSNPTRTTFRITRFSTGWFISNILPAITNLPIKPVVAGSSPALDIVLVAQTVERRINPKNIVRTQVQIPHGLMVRICVFHTQGRGSIPREEVFGPLAQLVRAFDC